MEKVENNAKCTFWKCVKVENSVDNQGKCVNNNFTLWKTSPQQFNVKDMICMKKLLAICSIFVTVCATLTSCGDNNDGHYTDDGNGAVIEDRTIDKHSEDTTEKNRDKSVRDRVDDAADGVGDAGKDIIGGAGEAGKDIIDGAENAADDVIDGLDGDKEHDDEKTTTKKKDR